MTQQRVLNQAIYPGVGKGPLDDCWVLADLMGVHACAPWSWLVNVKDYRGVAGVPDTDTGSEGGGIAASAKGIRGLYPKLVIEVSDASLTWNEYVARIIAGHPASLHILSGKLPLALQHGYTGTHRVFHHFLAGMHYIGNPLAKAYSGCAGITEAEIKAAALGDTAKVRALIFPTPAEAFTTHPLYVPPADCTAAVAAATGPLDARIAAAKIALG